MTEFAFSGLGINPHYDTPRNPYDRAAGRIPGGSSSGAAVSVTDGMAFGALGTDTGGSCRIPAALCGIVGYKPTANRIPTAGAFPLSTSLDSVGPLAPRSPAAPRSTPCSRASRRTTSALPARRPAARGAADHGARRRRARGGARVRCRLGCAAQAGARIIDIPLRELAELAQINAKGGLAALEAYAVHRALIARPRTSTIRAC